LAGGSAAAGVPLRGLAVGQRADFSVLDPASPALAGVPPQQVLDALVFSSPEAAMARACVAGREVAPRADTAAFVAAMQSLW
jgi:formimidoylglutamate deiminase